MARRNDLDDFTSGTMVRKMEDGGSFTNAAEEFGTSKSVVSRAWKAFQTRGTDVRKVGGGHSRKTTAVHDQCIFLQASQQAPFQHRIC
ncbi:uncharacterized protein TNCV_1681031 [Trichonephila clavipes]|nr:uncharacterized protein TNCV_1681031 [Trichonephila clavipes]